jgi:hypothetical protein
MYDVITRMCSGHKKHKAVNNSGANASQVTAAAASLLLMLRC